VPLIPQALGEGVFHGAFHQIQRGAIGLARIEGSPQSVRRGPREIAATQGDVAYLNIQLSGVGRVRSGGSVRKTNPGSGAIVLAEHLFELEFGDPFSQLCVAMPIAWLRDRVELPLGIAASRPHRVFDCKEL
jgi:AraC family transcriptional activator of tynA and feaB